ncbi:phosphatase PAP2 family protein [Streptomyces sp. DSM 44917]|uniref:Phosphatase PAP2 family protein n=1 Tax=Streptomyces boetiae TaxID=3075541 RepID=A0ABU2L4T8_9ACTN|nr:phosphatase PAP2 family protein [Streptomyces sp. DSM 44917]MDT0306576.1 phosphatase PAP2 family protein [Streptomyces sp. DSM 44917]
MPSTGALKRVRAAWDRAHAASRLRPPLLLELPLVIALYLGYRFGRRVANGQFSEAFANAERVWDLERALHLPSEAWVQDLVMRSETLIRGINVYYATVHFPAILLFMVWMYWRRPGHYLWARRVLTWVTGAALVLHLLVPLAPPRLYRTGDMVDTGVLFGPAVYDEPDPDSMANQFAAMPSLHVGWAVFIALALIVSSRTRWRWLWLLHPAVTVLAVVSTAHHYWMDGIVACLLLAATLLMLRPPPRPGAATGRTAPVPALASAPAASPAPEDAAAAGPEPPRAGLAAGPER